MPITALRLTCSCFTIVMLCTVAPQIAARDDYNYYYDSDNYDSDADEDIDPYETLGVPRTATKADVKKAYRKLVLTAHPDKDRTRSPAEAAKRFNRIKKAFEDLMAMEGVDGVPPRYRDWRLLSAEDRLTRFYWAEKLPTLDEAFQILGIPHAMDGWDKETLMNMVHDAAGQMKFAIYYVARNLYDRLKKGPLTPWQARNRLGISHSKHWVFTFFDEDYEDALYDMLDKPIPPGKTKQQYEAELHEAYDLLRLRRLARRTRSFDLNEALDTVWDYDMLWHYEFFDDKMFGDFTVVLDKEYSRGMPEPKQVEAIRDRKEAFGYLGITDPTAVDTFGKIRDLEHNVMRAFTTFMKYQGLNVPEAVVKWLTLGYGKPIPKEVEKRRLELRREWQHKAKLQLQAASGVPAAPSEEREHPVATARRALGQWVTKQWPSSSSNHVEPAEPTKEDTSRVEEGVHNDDGASEWLSGVVKPTPKHGATQGDSSPDDEEGEASDERVPDLHVVLQDQSSSGDLAQSDEVQGMDDIEYDAEHEASDEGHHGLQPDMTQVD